MSGKSVTIHCSVTGSGLQAYCCRQKKWEFPKIRGTLVWGPYYKDPTI